MVRWNLRCFPRILDNVMGTMVNLDGLSEYHFNDAGFVYMHKVRPLTGHAQRWPFLDIPQADACLCIWRYALLSCIVLHTHTHTLTEAAHQLVAGGCDQLGGCHEQEASPAAVQEPIYSRMLRRILTESGR